MSLCCSVADKLSENEGVKQQIRNNPRDQAMLGDFAQALDDAILDSSEVQRALMVRLLSDARRGESFKRLIFDMVWQGQRR